MQFTLTIDLGNDAMQTRADIESALRKLGQNCAYMSDPPEAGDDGSIRDENGNTVGKWEVTETPAVARAHKINGFWLVDFDGRRYPFGSDPDSEGHARRVAVGFADGSLDASRFTSNSATWEPLPEEDGHAADSNSRQ